MTARGAAATTASVPAEPRRTRVGIRLLALALILLSAVAAFGPWIAAGNGSPLMAAFVLAIVGYVVTGVLIMERRPGNRVGVIALALGAGFAGYLVIDGMIRAFGVQPFTTYAALIVQHSDGPLFFGIAMLFLFFPDGRLPSSRWRWLVAFTAVVALTLVVSSIFRPGPFLYYSQFQNPIGVEGYAVAPLYGPTYGVVVLCVVAAALSLVGRWRRGGPVERAQLKWVAGAASILAASMIAYGVIAGPGRYSDIGDLLVSAGFALIPVAIGIAVLRYRLYDIDRIISRTLAYAAVTALLATLFIATNLLLQGLLSEAVGANTLAVAASTLVVAGLFQPLRRAIQAPIDRRFNRARIDAERVVAGFAGEARDQVDLDRLRGAVMTAVNDSVAPSTGSMWLRVER